MLFRSGRSRDQINVKGLKINPLSLELQLTKNFDNIEDVVVFGNDTVKCIYTGLIDSTLIQRFLGSLGQHCRPSLVRQVREIPLSPGGKISRHFLNMIY